VPAAAGPGGCPVTGDGPGGRPGDRDPSQPRPASEGWAILSYLIGGMALYGLMGWLIGRWTGLPWLFPVGMLVGLASAIALVILRVTRS
jgi:F0F1-type ATP synthase assembly protein I